jgi:1,4-alpha-glucan branching enzyme
VSLAIVLHAHLPWIRHPELDRCPEEEWFFEAVAEVYIPLLRLLQRLRADGVRHRISLALDPTLLEMWSDMILMGRARAYLAERQELVARLLRDRPPEDPLRPALLRLQDLWTTAAAMLDHCRNQLIPAFGDLQDQGHLEILAGPASHPILPLLRSDEGRRAQLKVGVETYDRHFGRFPKGLWLPECAYHEGLDVLLRGVACQYTILDGHGILAGAPPPRAGLLAGARSPAEVLLFGRDPDLGRYAWGSRSYPGDFAYREFHRDLGDELPDELVAPLLGAGLPRRSLGFKTWAVTGDVPLSAKVPYDPAAAAVRAGVHADHWVSQVKARQDGARSPLPPVSVVCFDAEHLGHFWFEGPLFLEKVLRRCAEPETGLSLVTPTDWAARHGDEAPRVRPAPSSWGEGGAWELWWNANNDSHWRHLHAAEERMVRAATRHARTRNPPRRARLLAQAARELCIAQSSDWMYMLSSGRSVASFAWSSLQTHLGRAAALLTEVEGGDPMPRGRLEAWEEADPLFPDIRFTNWARPQGEDDSEAPADDLQVIR